MKPPNIRLKLTVRAARPLRVYNLVLLRTVARKGRAARPAA